MLAIPSAARRLSDAPNQRPASSKMIVATAVPRSPSRWNRVSVDDTWVSLTTRRRGPSIDSRPATHCSRIHESASHPSSRGANSGVSAVMEPLSSRSRMPRASATLERSTASPWATPGIGVSVSPKCSDRFLAAPRTRDARRSRCGVSATAGALLMISRSRQAQTCRESASLHLTRLGSILELQ